MHRIKDAIQLVEIYNSKHNPQTQLHGLDALQVSHYHNNIIIAGNFQGRKLARIGRKGIFHGENFHGMLN